MSIVVAQLGARMHYAVPRMLYRAGLLERCFTDICALKGWPRLLHFVPRAARPAAVRKLLARSPQGIPAGRITAFTGFGYQYARKIARARSTDERNAAFLWAGEEFARRVVARGIGGAGAVYVFNSAGLEVLREARRLGITGVLEQTIAPRAIEWKLLSDAWAENPNWEASPEAGMMKDYVAREAAEWAAADLIVCGSEFVRDGVVACGGPAERCAVVPYGLEGEIAAPKKAARRAGPLRVLTVGAVGLRKGSPHVLAAARKLAGVAEFRMVGAIQVQPEKEKLLREHVELVGVIPRSEMKVHYQWADVFLLPSLCEGSATSTYEALFAGLPVICTPETGSVVRDGIDGFIVPAGKVGAICDRLTRLAGDGELLVQMSESALRRSADYTLDKYSERLLACFRERNVIPP